MWVVRSKTECQNVDFVDAELDATDSKVSLPIEPFFDNFFA